MASSAPRASRADLSLTRLHADLRQRTVLHCYIPARPKRAGCLFFFALAQLICNWRRQCPHLRPEVAEGLLCGSFWRAFLRTDHPLKNPSQHRVTKQNRVPRRLLPGHGIFRSKPSGDHRAPALLRPVPLWQDALGGLRTPSLPPHPPRHQTQADPAATPKRTPCIP